MIDDLRELFNKYNKEDRIIIHYHAKVYSGICKA